VARPGGLCVIDADAVLERTIVLAAGTRLQCRGGVTLSPSDPGSLDQPGTAVVEYRPARPDTAVLVDGHGVKVQGCTIRDFDFGVVAVNLKAEPGAIGGNERIKIVGNHITAKTHAISLLNTD